MMTAATKARVAFQTIPHTDGTSAGCTTPASRATAAPARALQPMPRPRGCQTTRARVAAKMRKAASTVIAPGG